MLRHVMALGGGDRWVCAKPGRKLTRALPVGVRRLRESATVFRLEDLARLGLRHHPSFAVLCAGACRKPGRLQRFGGLRQAMAVTAACTLVSSSAGSGAYPSSSREDCPDSEAK